MGTSKSFPTPSGGGWTEAKSGLTSLLRGGQCTPSGVVGATARAAGGLFSGGTASGGRGTGGGGGAARSAGRAAVGRAVSGLGGLAVGVRERGLDGALQRLGLAELRGQPAIEVVARIAEHLAAGTAGTIHDVLVNALRDVILDAAALEGDVGYEALDVALQSFLNREGLDGLVELFLTRLVFDRVWSFIESHANERAGSIAESEATSSAIEGACRFHVSGFMSEVKQSGRFDSVDWFGREGQRMGETIAGELEGRLAAL